MPREERTVYGYGVVHAVENCGTDKAYMQEVFSQVVSCCISPWLLSDDEVLQERDVWHRLAVQKKMSVATS